MKTIKALINRNLPLSHLGGKMFRTQYVVQVAEKYYKAGFARKLVDTDDRTIYELTLHAGYSVRNIHISDAQSAESIAFVADLYQYENKIARIKNDGRGGCNTYTPLNGRAKLDEFLAWAKTDNASIAEREDQFVLNQIMQGQ